MRKISGKNLVVGVRPLQEAFDQHVNFEKIFIQKGIKNPWISELKKLCRSRNIPFGEVPIEKMKQLSDHAHQGLIGVLSEVEYQIIEELVPFWFEKGKVPLIVALDGVTDVRNLGAIIRTAVCFKADAVLWSIKNTAILNQAAIKSSSGAAFKIDLCRTGSLIKSLQFLKESGFSVVSASEEGEISPSAVHWSVPKVLVLGDEHRGVSPTVLEMSEEVCRIEMNKGFDSLNVSVAAGILLHNAFVQR